MKSVALKSGMNPSCKCNRMFKPISWIIFEHSLRRTMAELKDKGLICINLLCYAKFCGIWVWYGSEILPISSRILLRIFRIDVFFLEISQFLNFISLIYGFFLLVSLTGGVTDVAWGVKIANAVGMTMIYNFCAFQLSKSCQPIVKEPVIMLSQAISFSRF